MITHTELTRTLFYNPLTGLWIWLVTKGRKCKKGQQAGYIHHKGYRLIRWKGVNYLSSRLAWFYVTGAWPIEVDHKNNNPSDDRWENLRNATRQQNMRNQKKQVRVQFKGVVLVTKERKVSKYRARICLDGCVRHLGYFDTAQAAHTAYCQAATKYFGEFARHA